MKIIWILDFPSQKLCLAKFLFWSYCPKCCPPIRLQDSFKCEISRKKMRVQVDFWFPQFPTSGCYHFWLVWWGIPKVPKITSLQYPCNISRKSWGINMIFCIKIRIKVFYKLIVSSLLFRAIHAQSTQKIKFVIFLQYLKKKRKGWSWFFVCR